MLTHANTHHHITVRTVYTVVVKAARCVESLCSSTYRNVGERGKIFLINNIFNTLMSGDTETGGTIVNYECDFRLDRKFMFSWQWRMSCSSDVLFFNFILFSDLESHLFHSTNIVCTLSLNDTICYYSNPEDRYYHLCKCFHSQIKSLLTQYLLISIFNFNTYSFQLFHCIPQID